AGDPRLGAACTGRAAATRRDHAHRRAPVLRPLRDQGRPVGDRRRARAALLAKPLSRARHARAGGAAIRERAGARRDVPARAGGLQAEDHGRMGRAARRQGHLLRPGGHGRRNDGRSPGSPSPDDRRAHRPPWRDASDARQPAQALGHAADRADATGGIRRPHRRGAGDARLHDGRHREPPQPRNRVGRRHPPKTTRPRRYTMDFGFSEEQEMLRSSARDFLAKEAPMTYVRKMMDDERGYTDELWRKMAALGWMGLILPEEVGGSGLDFVDMVVVLEEMGRAVLPGPFFSTVILAGVAIAEGGSPAQKAAYLSKIADGSLKATLAHLEPSGRWDADGIQLEAKPDGGGGYVLTGTKL